MKNAPDFRVFRGDAQSLEDGAWREIGRFAGAAALMSVAPFEAVTIRLDDLGAPTEES